MPPNENKIQTGESCDGVLYCHFHQVGSNSKHIVLTLRIFIIPATGKRPTKKSNVEYYTPINEPITEYNNCWTPKEIKWGNSTGWPDILHHRYICSGCLYVLSLIWTCPDQYKYHIIMIGHFIQLWNISKWLATKWQGLTILRSWLKPIF